MKILDRYLVRQFLGTFVLLVLGLPVLFIITDLTDRLETYLGRGIPLKIVALSYLYYVPQLIFYGFPIAALIATVFTIGTMTRHQEITAAKAGGVSFYRLAAPLVLAAIILSLVAVVIGEGVPPANVRRAEMIGDRERYSNTPLRMNLVYRTENGRTLSTNQINSLSQSMTQVVLEGREESTGLRVHQSAAGASWDEHTGWALRDGYLRWRDDEGTDASLSFVALQTPDLSESPEELVAAANNPEEMRYAELQKFIRTIERSGGNSSEFRVGLAQKISLPLALFVIVLFGAPLATTSQRGGTAMGIGISLTVTMTYLMLFKVGEAMGKSGTLDPVLAAWAPNAIFLVAGLFLLWRVRT